MQPALWPVIVAGGSEQFLIDPVNFSTVPSDGIDPDGFTVTGTCRDRSQSQEYPVIVEYGGPASGGAHGEFEPRD